MNQLTSNFVTRRTILRGAAGALSLPFLGSIARAATPNKTPPKRLVFLGGGYGFTKQTFYPTETGRFETIGLTEGLKPLLKHQNDITMVSNLTNHGASNPHGGSSHYLSGANVGVSRGTLVSCDQVAAATLGKETRFASLVVTAKENIPGQGVGHGGGFSLSIDSQGNSMPGLAGPLELYRTIFAQKGDTLEKVRVRLAQKQSVLDVVRLDAGSVNSTLNSEDKHKLEEYFSGVRQIELDLERQAKWLGVPKAAAPFDPPAESVSGEEEIKLVYRMLAIALQTDMTRIATYRLPVQSLISGMEIHFTPHQISHYGAEDAKMAASKQRDAKIMELFAYFLDLLKAAKDSDGSRLYDNCIVSYGTNLRSGHELKNLPALISGGGAPKIKHGRHVVLPKTDTPLVNLWLTLLHQAGVQTDSFNNSTGEVSELLS